MTHMLGFPDRPDLYRFTSDLPGFYHHLACGFSFVDGHSEIKRWRDSRTMPPLVRGAVDPLAIDETPAPNDPDVAWLQERTTRRK